MFHRVLSGLRRLGEHRTILVVMVQVVLGLLHQHHLHIVISIAAVTISIGD